MQNQDKVEKLTCYIPYDIYEKLNTISEITSKQISEILSEAILKIANPYENKYGKIKVIPAIYLKETNNGIKEEQCLLLDKLKFDNLEYGKILYDNHICVVLFSQIKL